MMPNLDRCPCTGATLSKLTRPALLAALARGPLYGYRIAEELALLPIVKGDKPDTTGLYRTLKSMEERGLVLSEWEPSEVGPDRRLYELTIEGRKCLGRWTETLADYHKAVGDLFRRTRRAFHAASPGPQTRKGGNG